MKIDLTFTEAIEIEQILEAAALECSECLADQNFKKQYPASYESIQNQYETYQNILVKVRELLD